MTLQQHILNRLDEAETLAMDGDLVSIASILADVLGLIKHHHKRGDPPIKGIHVNTRAGYMIIGCRGIVPDELEDVKATAAGKFKPRRQMEIVDPSGNVSYRRPEGDPMIGEALKTPGYTVRPELPPVAQHSSIAPECPECGAAIVQGICVNCGVLTGDKPIAD
jgi:hypothetical protein